MQLPLRVAQRAGPSLQAQIFEQLRQLIADGRLKPDMRLPPSRVLAADLGVSRNTVVLAYERLVAEGYLEVRQPVGTFVASAPVFEGFAVAPPAEEAPEAAGLRRSARLRLRGQAHVVRSPYEHPVRYDFWVGRPDARLFPLRIWRDAIRRLLPEMHAGHSDYGHPAGLPALRQAVADHVGAARGIKTCADEVLITHGIQEALSILARLFVRDGTEVATENPCYLGAARVFASHGARLTPVDVDDEGIDVDRLPRDAAFVYVTPSHPYPIGATLSPQRRSRLHAWAARCGSYIVEDDYDSDFHYDATPLPAMKAEDEREQVIYLGTFSKSLGAGLRVGYMVLPRHLVADASCAKALLNNCSPWYAQALLAEYLSSGAFAHHLRRVRTIYRARRNRLIEALERCFGEARIAGAQAGMHLTWELPRHFPLAAELERRARAYEVGVYGLATGNALVTGPVAEARFERTVMLGYAALDEDEIDEGVARLAQACRPSQPLGSSRAAG